MTSQEIILLAKFESAILDICYNQDQFTTSDLQGAIQAQVQMIFTAGKQAGKDTE